MNKSKQEQTHSTMVNRTHAKDQDLHSTREGKRSEGVHLPHDHPDAWVLDGVEEVVGGPEDPLRILETSRIYWAGILKEALQRCSRANTFAHI